MTGVHGQHDGRTERINQTIDWLNATPLSPVGDVIELDPEPCYDTVATHVNAIQVSLAAGTAKVVVTERHKPTRDALKSGLASSLSPVDYARVKFDPHDPVERMVPVS